MDVHCMLQVISRTYSVVKRSLWYKHANIAVGCRDAVFRSSSSIVRGNSRKHDMKDQTKDKVECSMLHRRCEPSTVMPFGRFSLGKRDSKESFRQF